MDINVMIRTEEGIGFGYVYDSDNDYRAMMYQDRIDESLNDVEAIFESLGEGKAYIEEVDSINEGIVTILGFYFINPDNIDDFEVIEFNDINDAIKHFNESVDDFMICKGF